MDPTAPMPPLLSLRGVGMRFPTGVQALEALDLDVAPGEFLSLLGPSGCGKSTALRLIAGLARATAGEVARPPAARLGFDVATPGGSTGDSSVSHSRNFARLISIKYAKQIVVFDKKTTCSAL